MLCLSLVFQIPLQVQNGVLVFRVAVDVVLVKDVQGSRRLSKGHWFLGHNFLGFVAEAAEPAEEPDNEVVEQDVEQHDDGHD